MWNKLSISYKIISCLVITLLLTILLFGSTFYALHHSGTAFRSLTQRDGPTFDHAHDAKILLLDSRRYEKDALYNDDQSLITTLKENAQKLLVEATELAALIATTRNAHLTELSQDFLKTTRDYQAALDAAAAAPVGQTRMMAALPMRKAFNASEQLINQILDESLQHVKGMAAASVRSIAIAELLSTVIGLMAIGAGAFFAFLLTLSIVRPLKALHARTEKLAQGDVQTAIPFLSRGDEIGAMANALCIFRDNRAESERLRQEQEQQRARAEQGKRDALNQLVERFESSVRGAATMVVGAATQLQTTAKTMKSAVETTMRTVGTMAGHVDQSQSASGQATDEVRRSDDMVTSLQQAVAKISEVSNLINSIAGQTNLLALNATIEAARAGEAGRGFAVVANEVKTLAAQTGKATGDINQHILSVQKATDDTIASIHSIDSSISNISTINAKLAAAVQGTGSANDTPDDVSVTRSVAATTQAADDVMKAADELSRQGTTMLEEIERVKAFVVVLAAKS